MVSRKNKTKRKSKLIKGYKKNRTRKYKKTNALIKRPSKKRTKKMRGGETPPLRAQLNSLQRNGISRHPNYSHYFNQDNGIGNMRHALSGYAHTGMNAIPGLLGHIHNFAQYHGASMDSPYEYNTQEYNNNITALHGMMTNPRSLHIEKVIVNYLNLLLHMKEQQAMGYGQSMMGQEMGYGQPMMSEEM